jgi:hypothetical protein
LTVIKRLADGPWQVGMEEATYHWG